MCGYKFCMRKSVFNLLNFHLTIYDKLSRPQKVGLLHVLSMSSLVGEIKDYKVSSVLNGDKKMYGKKFLFDGKDETCWNSDKGSSQRIEFSFNEPKTVTQLKIQFQGGFAAKQIQMEGYGDSANDDELEKCEFHPHDTNQVQKFQLEKPITASIFKLTLNSSFDFYGRIIIYHLDVIGSL